MGNDSLELIPRLIRDKLDRVGIKLHLREWQALPVADRERLRDLPCQSEDQARHYSDLVEQLIHHATGHAPDRIL